MSRDKLYLFGYPIAHSVSPPVQDFVAQNLGSSWRCSRGETPNVEDIVNIMAGPDFAGGAVTMPHKVAIIEHLDAIDEQARTIGAVNTIKVDSDGRLIGMNTDAAGIRDTFLEKSTKGSGQPGLVIGTGGAARAAIYAMLVLLKVSGVYLVARDHAKATALAEDLEAALPEAKGCILVIKSATQADSLPPPHYAISCVPNASPATYEDSLCREIAATILQRGNRGIFLDMCFRPRVTQLMDIASEWGWVIVDGIEVLGFQLLEQWRIWQPEQSTLPVNEARAYMRELATNSTQLGPQSQHVKQQL